MKNHVAIVTRYFPPTAKSDAKIRAYSPSGSWNTFIYNTDISAEENHDSAAREQMLALGFFEHEVICGLTNDKRGYTYLIVPKAGK